MKLSEELTWRGFVAEHTLGEISDLDKAPRKFYWGVDPSAPSMTIGNLAALMMVKCFIRHGYEAVLLAGGATGQIGDPKETEERDIKPLAEVEANVRAIEEQFRRIAGDGFLMVNNNDWFSEIRFIPFLREVGKQFSMTQLLDRKFVQERIGEAGAGISYAEFSYSLIQGYDFLHLYREHGVDLQLCGADQFGNCVSGIHLIRRLENKEADVWSTPLVIDKVSGRKFGKSEGNAVWLSAEMTSIWDFYQFWLGLADEGLDYYLKIYTFITPDELTELMAEHNEKPSERVAQKKLASAVTAIVHGETQAKKVAQVAELLFKDAQLAEQDYALLAEFIPVVDQGSTLVETLVQSGIAASKAAARQLIKSGAIMVNGNKISDDIRIVQRAIIKKGKNKFVLIR